MVVRSPRESECCQVSLEQNCARELFVMKMFNICAGQWLRNWIFNLNLNEKSHIWLSYLIAQL